MFFVTLLLYDRRKWRRRQIYQQVKQTFMNSDVILFVIVSKMTDLNVNSIPGLINRINEKIKKYIWKENERSRVSHLHSSFAGSILYIITTRSLMVFVSIFIFFFAISRLNFQIRDPRQLNVVFVNTLFLLMLADFLFYTC